MTTKIEPSDKALRALGNRAAQAGDTRTVADVTAALHGNKAARERCAAQLRAGR